MKEILELEDISAGYEQTTVLQGVNLTIRENDFIGIIGPNGGGKTTLLKVILGLIKPFSGKIIYHTSKQSLFGYLPQNSKFDARFPISVKEVVLSGLMSEKGIFHSYTKADRGKVDEILEKYGMLRYKNRPIGELSGGQMQRVFLCRAIISSPKILILDEPSTYVDSNFEIEFYSLLKELNEKMSIVMVSHDLGTICSYVKTIACVNGGLHYHESNLITPEQLKLYNCPIELISHGTVPHRVLLDHDKAIEN
ncbi:metal ABC transporter ATP-binding protein [Butyricimonas sp.]|uniref:metal ABC transporter ATP-binding protein n=1 Tax=Butyricimonas sp. TaxID=1969738 RepID=UPI0025C6C877|nr:metal ABC transporter ATP-binding protein [Butyricimonas sp.]